MARFFEDDRLVDCGAIQSQEDAEGVVEPNVGENGGISNQYCLNDYRNRMPFHYVEEGDDGYYYWHYGATMVIEIELEDLSLAITDDTPLFVIDVKRNGQSITDPAMIADILLGSMADEDREDYYTKQQIIDKFNIVWSSLNSKTAALKNTTQELEVITDTHRTELDTINTDLYDLSGPLYLIDRIIQGNNIEISRDASGEVPKLVINSQSTKQVAAIIGSGTGTEEDPFIAITSQPVNWNLDNTLLILLFKNLSATGLEYTKETQYYASFTTTEGALVKNFSIVSPSVDRPTGRLYNTIYFALNGVLADGETIEQIRVFDETESVYEVVQGQPFVFIRGSKESITINEEVFTTAFYRNAILEDTLEEIAINKLSSTVPVTATVMDIGQGNQLFVDVDKAKRTDIETIIDETVVRADMINFETVALEETDWELPN